MTATAAATAAQAQPEFVLSRTLDASRERVWNTWTDPQEMAQWFGPKGFKGTAVKMDFRVGGTYHYYLESPQGLKMWGKCTYREIAPPSRLVWINAFSDENEATVRHPLNADWPEQMLTTVTFVEQAGKTTVTVRWNPIDPTEKELRAFEEGMGSMQQGWTGTFEQLQEYLGKKA